MKRLAYVDPFGWMADAGSALGTLFGAAGGRRAAPSKRHSSGHAATRDEPPVPSGIGSEPRHHGFLSLGPHGFHRIAYSEWGDVDNPHIVMCLHGFTRNRHDFDVLAARLSEHCRVVCMDAVGRGDSDWLAHKEDYDYALYLSDAAALLARVTEGTGGRRAVHVDWIGTSMGGLVGMLLAAKPNSPIRRLVLNDVGPLIPWGALTRLRNMHLPLGVRFDTLDAVEAHLREIFATFGPLPDAAWRYVAWHSARRREDGSYVLAYDPSIMNSINHARNGIEFGNNFFAGVDLWPVWDRVACPTLTLRGAESDVLTSSVALEMGRRGPRATVVEFPGIGHAPWLMADDQIAVVREFLLAAE